MTNLASFSGSKGQNIAWFSPNITPAIDWNPISIHIAINTTSVVQYTLDGGTNWVDLNSGESITANRGYQFHIPILKPDQFNLRHTNASTVTVIFARVDQ